MAKIEGGNGLNSALKNIATKLQNASSVEVGFIDGRTYPDGQYVAAIAAVQEFGGTIQVPEKETTIYRKLDKEGELANNGRFVKQSKSNFATTHVVPAHTINIPPRPFFRNMINKSSKNWPANLMTALKTTKFDAEKALGLVGQHISDELQESIRSNTPPPNAKSTIKGKGSARTLIDTGLMLDSVTHLVK